MYCPHCSYNLRGITSTRCPECGEEVNWSTITAARVPWEHRAEIGRLRAYWRTLLLAYLHPAKLGDAVLAPAHYDDASRFRWITMLLVWTVFWVVPVGHAIYMACKNVFQISSGLPELPPLPEHAFSKPFEATAGSVLLYTLTLCAASLLTLLWATASGRAFFRRRALPIIRRNRAMAVGMYTSTYFILPGLFLSTLAALGTTSDALNQYHLLPHALVGPAALAALWGIIAWAVVLQQATDLNIAPALMCAVLQTLQFLTVGILIIYATAWMTGFVMIVLLSL